MTLKSLPLPIAIASMSTILFAAGFTAGQSRPVTPAIPQYIPTELQRSHLHEAQLEAQLAQVALQQAQRDFQDKLQALRAMGEQVKKENKWADDVQFDIANLTYSAPTPQKGTKP